MNKETADSGRFAMSESDLLQGTVRKTLLSFSFPLMLSTLLQTFYSMADTIIVGQIHGSVGLSAASTGSQVMNFIVLICVGFSTSGQTLIAQAAGHNKLDKVQSIMQTLFHITIISSLLMMAVCVMFCEKILQFMEVPPEAFEQAWYYLLICGIGTIFTGLYNMLSAWMRGLGDSKRPFMFVLVASVMNVILDLIFVAGFHWNVAGAALATVMSQFISVIFSFFYVFCHKEILPFKIRWKKFLPDVNAARQILVLGIPLSFQNAAVQISFLFVGRMVNTLGVEVSAALGVFQKLRNLPGIMTQALTLGATSMIGQNLGARRHDRVKQTMNYCLLYTTVIASLFAGIYLLMPEGWFQLFTQDEKVLAYAGMCMVAQALELPARILMSCTALINAQGFAGLSLSIGLVDAFVGRVFLCWLFGVVLQMGAFGFFLGYCMGTYLSGIPAAVYFVSGLWKKRGILI